MSTPIFIISVLGVSLAVAFTTEHVSTKLRERRHALDMRHLRLNDDDFSRRKRAEKERRWPTKL